MAQLYPKRLIEVDLPIKRISAHARRDKSMRQGHIQSLHIWWARRPLSACRAVICAALWPDPADELCPESFRKAARELMSNWADHNLGLCSSESYGRFLAIQRGSAKLIDDIELRGALLDFIADFANWDNSTVPAYLRTSRALTQAAHEALGGAPGTRPLVVDPFAGGGSIPLEALRVGADAFASDLNPIPVLLNKAVLEYIPKYGERLATEVRKLGEWVRQQAEKELGEFYPKDADGATPIAYLWARTMQCEGPGCGAEVPMVNQLWIKKKGSPTYAFEFSRSTQKRIEIRIVENPAPKSVAAGTSRQGSVTCPCCGFTTPAAGVRAQGCQKGLGTRLMAVVLSLQGSTVRRFRTPTVADFTAIEAANDKLKKLETTAHFSNALRVKIPLTELRRISVPLYGVDTFEKMFLPRQRLAFDILGSVLQRAFDRQKYDSADAGFHIAVSTILALSISSTLHYNMNLSTYLSNGMVSAFIQGTSLAMRSDFAEANPLMQKLVGGSIFLSTRST
jgi:putative DNA methylase